MLFPPFIDTTAVEIDLSTVEADVLKKVLDFMTYNTENPPKVTFV